MANDFKNTYATNVLSTGSGTTLYTTPASKVSIVLEIDIANTSTDNITADVVVDDSANAGAATIYLVKGAPIPANGTIKIINGQKLILNAQQLLKVKVDAASAADCIVSLLEDA